MKTALIRRQKALVLYTIAALTWSWSSYPQCSVRPSRCSAGQNRVW